MEDADDSCVELNISIADRSRKERVAFCMTSGKQVEDYEQSSAVESIPTGVSYTFQNDVHLPFEITGKIVCFLPCRYCYYGSRYSFNLFKVISLP